MTDERDPEGSSGEPAQSAGGPEKGDPVEGGPVDDDSLNDDSQNDEPRGEASERPAEDGPENVSAPERGENAPSSEAGDADRRALSDAVRDALASRAASGEQPFTPVRSRPVLPRALGTGTIAAPHANADADAPADPEPDADAPAGPDDDAGFDARGARAATPIEDADSAEQVRSSPASSAESAGSADLSSPDEKRMTDDDASPAADRGASTDPITEASPASATWADIEPIPEHDQLVFAPERIAADAGGDRHPPTPSAEAVTAEAAQTSSSDSRVDASAVPAVAAGADAATSAGADAATSFEGAEPTEAVPVEAEADPDGPSSLESPVRIDEPVAARRRFRGRGAIAVGARALVGIAGIGIAAIAIAGSTIAPLPRYTSAPPEVTVTPVAAAQQRVCPGPLLRLGTDEGQEATSATSVGRASDQYQAEPRDAEANALPQTENSAGTAPLLLTLPPGSEADEQVAAVAGSQTQAVRSGDLVGLASAECAEAAGEIWLVGGSTDVGRTTLITLSNPTTVIATVRMRVFGAAGEVVAPGLDGIVVPPGSQRIFSLAGFAPQLAAPVVKVESRGGLVVANLQQTTVRTLDPGGVDIVGATHAPARELTIPGVLVSGSAQISGAQDQLGFEDLQATLRIFNPGTDMTTATVAITPARGTVAPPRTDSVAVEGAAPGSATDEGGFEVDLGGGQVTEIPFPGLADGDYTVTVSSRAPVVAGARVSTVSEDGVTDFAWLPAAAPLNDRALVSVASGPSPVLRLVNPTNEERTVTVSAPDGDVEVDLDAGESVSTPMRSGHDATLTAAAGMFATVTYLGTGQISAFGLTSPGPASGDIVVYR